MDASEIEGRNARSAAGEIPDELLDPFISATCLALGEMTGTEVVVQSVCPKAPDRALGDITAVVGLTSSSEGFLVLSFPKSTAAAIASRVLAGVTTEVDDTLIRDCMGEIANVTVGQAKALLAETPFRFVFSMPRVVAGRSPELLPKPGRHSLVVTFQSDLGDFAMQLTQDR